MKNKGFSLVELLVSMVIFMLVVGVIYVVLRNMCRDYRTEVEKAESQVQEILTFPLVPDLKNAGFGMPDNYSGCSGVDIPGENFGRVPCDCLAHANEPPKPICACNDAGVNKSDVLVIHSSIARINEYTRCYGYYLYDDADVKLLSEDCPGDLVLSILYIPTHPSSSKSISDVEKKLKCSGSRYLFKKDEISGIKGIHRKAFYFLYGIGNSTEVPPFNTVVYYLKEYEDSECPSWCCNCTGVLERAYRTNSGSFHSEPVMHCVLDFQVWVYNDTAGKYIDLESAMDSSDVRRDIKSAVVFIVQQSQDGDVYENGTITLSHGGRVDVRDYGDDIKRYRWKVLKYHVYLESLGVH